MTTQVVVEQILNGELDGELDAVSHAVRTRRGIVGQIQASTLQPGDRVVFGAHTRPKYLQGAEATVVGRGRGKRVPVKLDVTRGRFPAGVEIKAVAGTLEKRDD